MVDKSKFNIEGKTPDEVKLIYKEYLNKVINQHGTNYENLTSQPLPEVTKEVLGIDSLFKTVDIERLKLVRQALTKRIDAEPSRSAAKHSAVTRKGHQKTRHACLNIMMERMNILGVLE